MGFLEFQWSQLPDDLLSALGHMPELEGLAVWSADGCAAALGSVIGPAPSDGHAASSWRAMRDGWVLADPERTRRLAGLFDALGVGRAARESADDDADFLRSIRDSAKLRGTVVRYLVALGSGASAVEDPVELAASADRDQIETAAYSAADTVPSGFVPSNSEDFQRLDGLNDLQWGQFMIQVFDAVTHLLPAETLIMRARSGESANAGDQGGSLGAIITHLAEDRVRVTLAPESSLPRGVTYERLWPRLSELGWSRDVSPRHGSVVSAEFPWQDGVDDGIALLTTTLRQVFLVPSPTWIDPLEEIPRPEGLLPLPPSDVDVVRPESAQDLLSVVGSIIRRSDGTVLAGGDPQTHAFRLGPWSGWIHADSTAPVLDAVVVVSDIPSSESFDATRMAELQSSQLKYGRIVVTDSQIVVAARAPFHAVTNAMVHSFMGGLIEDADTTLRVLGEAKPPLPLGGYL